MKQAYLVYNNLTENYFFTPRSNPKEMKGRINFKDEADVIQRIPQEMNPKRKSILNLINVPNELKARLSHMLSNTKISLMDFNSH